jgi:predicted HicB family RNase H-like nuclease
MKLSPFINALQQSLKSTAAPVGKDVAEAASLLALSLEPAARLCLLEAMSGAADEITLALENTSVEARLRGQDIDFVVNEPTHTETTSAPTEPIESQSTDDVVRITLRLQESLKDSVEQAAKSASLSVNGWLVSAIASAVDSAPQSGHGARHGKRDRSYKGFARS